MKKENEQKILLSGIQPSGNLALGNYIGALKNWIKLQKEYRCIFFVVDLHCLTVRQEPKELRKRCLEFITLYLACGIEPEGNLIFLQSQVPAHSELAWILNCFTYMGELNRMTQFKEKSERHAKNINSGLYTYPVLMASDILLYQTDLVPVGQDQKQHLELTRDLAVRFNNYYGNVFKIPEPFIPEVGARIMSLQDPQAKMSKSDENPKNYIALLDKPDIIRSKIKRAVTDPGKEIIYDEKKPGIANLLTIYSCLSGKTIGDIQKGYQGKGYKEFKKDLGDVIVESLEPIQKNYEDLTKNKDYIHEILKKGSDEAKYIAQKTLNKVQKKVGIIKFK